MEDIELNVLDLYLDTDNPRHEPIKDRNSIISHLVKHEKVKTLAKDISERGVSPLELSGVIVNDQGNHIVVEGNRRICALLLLNDPALAPEGEKSYFDSLSKGNILIPQKIKCIKFSDRDEAKTWIELRHNGAQGGAGLLSWDANQKARFFNASENTLALKLLDYAALKGLISEEDRQSKILTTAARFLGNPYFRKTLGITTGRSDPEVKIDVEQIAFDKVIKRFISDLLDDNNEKVSSRSKKSDWESYARQLQQEGVAPISYGEERPLISEKKKEDSKKKTDVRNNPSPDSRNYIVPSDFKVIINDKILKRIFDELKNVNCNEFTLASSLVCRAFLENLYSLYYEKLFGNFPDKMLTHLVLDKILKSFESDEIKGTLTKKEKSASGALRRVQTNESNVLSPRTLGAFAHGGWYPDPKQLKREWDNITPILLFMLKNI